jgi:hypothetical protein
MNSQNLHLKHSIQNVFDQLAVAMQGLTAEQYSAPSAILFKASIGQHVRHIIELFFELSKGYETGVVNYEKRKRDYRIETDKDFAMELLGGIISGIERPDKVLQLEAGYKADAEELITMDTNYYRELAYNLEHTIHHMALIRVGINELSAVQVDESFGIASATIKYRSTCAQ